VNSGIRLTWEEKEPRRAKAAGFWRGFSVAAAGGILQWRRRLAVLALLQCGDAIKDERLFINGTFMKGCLAELRTLDMGRYQTYGRGLRATAWPSSTARKMPSASRTTLIIWSSPAPWRVHLHQGD